MNRPIARLALGATLVTGLALPSNSAVWLLQAYLDGLQEVPPNASTATGVASMSYNDVTNLFNLGLFVTGIAQSDLIGSHIHGPAPPGSNAGVIFNIGDGSTYSVTGSGLARNIIDGGPFPQANEADLLSNLTYINVHTNAFPGGEIRGQLIVVPEPATLAALTAGLGLLAVRRRRR